MAPFNKGIVGSESSIPTLPLNGIGAGEPQRVIPMRNAMAAASQPDSHLQPSDSILSQAFTEATQLNANGAIFGPLKDAPSENSPSYLATMSTNSAHVSPELMSVSMSHQHPSTSMVNSAAILQQQRVSPGSSSNMSSSPPVLANFNSVGETMPQAQLRAVHQPILDGRGVLGNGGHQSILHDGRGVLGNGRVPATRRDGRKLFVGGLPNEGKLTRTRSISPKISSTFFDTNTQRCVLSVTDLSFLQYFQQYGEVIDSVVLLDRRTKRSRGFGFV